jgi:broad specificity phosphatase PhoE
VCFIRHGVAKHNLPDPKTQGRPNLEDPALFDPQLVYQGKQQALDAGERLKIWWKTTQLEEQLELVICSPLTRCIQTSMLAFLPGDYTFNDDRVKEPNLFCTEMVREAYGMHYPDKRRDKLVLQVRRFDV